MASFYIDENTTNTSLEELEKEITCAICHEHYTDPKLLPCLHYYCKQCIHTLALRTGIDKPFPCPECRTDTTLPQGSVDHLKPAFVINRMTAIHTNLSKAHGKVEAMCESCSGDKAEAFCRQCEQFICAECVKQHRRMKIFASHKTVSLDELKKGGAKDIVVPEASPKMCEEHDELMKIYCFDCSCLICRDCIIKDHSGHNHEFIKKAAPKVSKELLEQLDPLNEVKVNISHTMEEIKTIKAEVKVQVDTVSKKIKTSFNELRQILANREQALLKEATAEGEQKLDLLSSQEKKLSTSRAVIQSVIEYTKQCLEHATNEDIMSMRADIQSQIKRELTQLESEDLYEPVEEADIALEVKCAEDLKQICLAKAKLTQPVLEYSVTGTGIHVAYVNQIAEFYVTAKRPGQKQSKRIANLESYIQFRTVQLKDWCKVDLVKNYEYRIQYTPTFKGQFQITLTAGGQQVPGSPFQVKAQAKKPIYYS